MPLKVVSDDFIAPPCHGHIKLLYQDESLLVISKPTGLLSLSGKNPLNKDSVHCRLVKDFPGATLVHRLDLGTSGVMIVALNKQINGQLSKQFQQRTVGKSYKAMLYGHLQKEQGVIDLAIAKDSALFPRLKVCAETGKKALTHYVVEERKERPLRSLVRFTPDTGRTHQLRIHSQAIGHPILGCDLYGDHSTQHLADRLMLHAESIHFVHPVTNEKLHVVCPCPF